MWSYTLLSAVNLLELTRSETRNRELRRLTPVCNIELVVPAGYTITNQVQCAVLYILTIQYIVYIVRLRD